MHIFWTKLKSLTWAFLLSVHIIKFAYIYSILISLWDTLPLIIKKWIRYYFKIRDSFFNHSFVTISSIKKIHYWNNIFFEILVSQFLFLFLTIHFKLFYFTYFLNLNTLRKHDAILEIMLIRDWFREIEQMLSQYLFYLSGLWTRNIINEQQVFLTIEHLETFSI